VNGLQTRVRGKRVHKAQIANRTSELPPMVSIIPKLPDGNDHQDEKYLPEDGNGLEDPLDGVGEQKQGPDPVGYGAIVTHLPRACPPGR
jgi:hypothetical protein